MYHIYKLRQCDTIKSGFSLKAKPDFPLGKIDYSKSKILEDLNTFYNNRKQYNYQYLLFTFMYLRGNLQQFNHLVPKNEYKYYIISDDNKITYGSDHLTSEELKHKLDQQCQAMYEQLVSTISKLS
jgi:hypothetical protein